MAEFIAIVNGHTTGWKLIKSNTFALHLEDFWGSNHLSLGRKKSTELNAIGWNSLKLFATPIFSYFCPVLLEILKKIRYNYPVEYHKNLDLAINCLRFFENIQNSFQFSIILLFMTMGTKNYQYGQNADFMLLSKLCKTKKLNFYITKKICRWRR